MLMAHRRARLLSSAWPFAESSCSSRVYQTISLSFSLILFLCFCFCRCRWFSLLTIWPELNPTAQMAVIPEYALPHLVHFLAHRPGSFCVSTSANASACVHMHMPVLRVFVQIPLKRRLENVSQVLRRTMTKTYGRLPVTSLSS
jgi:hypothetical protein